MILASASPRRAEILRSLGISFEVRPADVDEAPRPGETPTELASRLSRLKAEAVARDYPDEWVVGGDTVVAVDGALLGKPTDLEDAVRMLLRLEGRTHEVVSALTLVLPARDSGSESPLTEFEVTAVTFRAFGPELARSYAESGEAMGKAGAYAIQGSGAALVERIEGDHSAVVGLPVPALMRLFDRAGRPYRFDG